MGGLLSRILRFFGIGLAVVSNESEVLDQRASAAFIQFDPRQKVVSNGQDYCAVPIQFRGSARQVFVTGSWLNWEDKVELKKNSENPELWEGEVNIPVQFNVEFEFKFIVDDEWVISNDYASKTTNIGTKNNIMVLVPEPDAAPDALKSTASVIVPSVSPSSAAAVPTSTHSIAAHSSGELLVRKSTPLVPDSTGSKTAQDATASKTVQDANPDTAAA